MKPTQATTTAKNAKFDLSTLDGIRAWWENQREILEFVDYGYSSASWAYAKRQGLYKTSFPGSTTDGVHTLRMARKWQQQMEDAGLDEMTLLEMSFNGNDGERHWATLQLQERANSAS